MKSAAWQRTLKAGVVPLGSKKKKRLVAFEGSVVLGWEDSRSESWNEGERDSALFLQS